MRHVQCVSKCLSLASPGVPAVAGNWRATMCWAVSHQNWRQLVFTGNPGTGKTTVARLIGELYRDLGLLQREHLVETKVSDLVAGHVGGTAIKTSGVIDKALDGVLCIDEAYQLTEPERGGFGLEAVGAL